MKKKNNNKMKNGRSGRGRSYISLLSFRSLPAGLAMLALLVGIGTSCSSGMDDEAMTRTGAPMTVTATMQGVAKPAAAVSEVVSGDGTALPATRTTTADNATAGVYTAAWQKGDVVNVTFHCYSDADGATEIDAALMSNGNTQTLTYDGTAWTASPASLRLPADIRSVKAVYAYSRTYSAAGDTPIDGTTISTLMNRGTESIAGQSFIIAPDDITKTGIAIAPAADKWQRLTALVRFTSLAFGQSARVTSASGVSTLVSCPTVQTADPTQAANSALVATVYVHQPVDDPATPTAVTTVTVDGLNGAVKPAFHTEAGRLYSIYVPVLLGELGAGDDNGGQAYTTWSGTYAQFYNNGFGASNIEKYSSWIIDLSAENESDKVSAVASIKGRANVRTTTVNVTLTGIGTVSANAFRGCSKLASISLPEITSLGEGAFYQCTALTSVSLPVATSIGNYAFYQCTALTSVSLPVATNIGDNTFSQCSALTSASLPVAKSLGTYTFNFCTALTSVNLPVVTNIGNAVFYHCYALTSVNLSVTTSLGNYAFYNCTALTSVNLPIVTSLGEGAFSNCSMLTSVDLPKATSLGNYAFYNCTALTSMNLPIATSFGGKAFADAPLTTLKLTAAGAMTFDANAFFYFTKSANCTLTLNTDKQSGSVLPQASGNTWGGLTWKAIQYE